ncbi:MAG: Dam family site-specific DNA-(adenine-N6)-methyltransferase [Chloroflexota bacterium]
MTADDFQRVVAPEPRQTASLPPLFRWAGSKRQLVPTLAQYWPTNARSYIEPFAGSASLFFYLQPERAVLADLNPDLIDTYRTIRSHPDEVWQSLSKYAPDAETYYRVRALRGASLSEADRAARFTFLNRLAFNGLHRTNASGHFNVPFGGAKSGQLPSLQTLRTYSHVLRRADLRHGDFAAVLSSVQAGDFVYMDPPYTPAGWRRGLHYTGDAFGPADLERLKATSWTTSMRAAEHSS